jgi:hypothetical protein
MAKGRDDSRHDKGDGHGKNAGHGDAMGHDPAKRRSAEAEARPPRAHNDPAGRGSQDNSRREQGSERRTHR